MTDTPVTIARGDGSLVDQGRRVVVRDDSEWQKLWAAHAGPDAAPPAVDFSTRMVVAAFAGERPSPGWESTIVGSRRDGSLLAVLVEDRRPPPGTVAAQMIVHPFHIASIPRYDGEVRFADVRAETAAPGVAMGRERHRRNPSSTGLQPHVAGALAYLAGPVSGALLVALERSSHFVRFHAWQSLVGLGVLGLVALLSLGSAFVLLIVSPTAFWTFLWVAAVFGVWWLVFWAICLVQAFRGHRWKMPLVGGYAERRAHYGGRT